MNSKSIYKKETGENANKNVSKNNKKVNILTKDYFNWLEKTVEEIYEPTLLTWIKKMFIYANENKWDKTYWV
jgi:hypothetical protein